MLAPDDYFSNRDLGYNSTLDKSSTNAGDGQANSGDTARQMPGLQRFSLGLDGSERTQVEDIETVTPSFSPVKSESEVEQWVTV